MQDKRSGEDNSSGYRNATTYNTAYTCERLTEAEQGQPGIDIAEKPKE